MLKPLALTHFPRPLPLRSVFTVAAELAAANGLPPPRRADVASPLTMATVIHRLALEQGRVDWTGLTSAGFTPAEIAAHLPEARALVLRDQPNLAPYLHGLTSPATEIATQP